VAGSGQRGEREGDRPTAEAPSGTVSQAELAALHRRASLGADAGMEAGAGALASASTSFFMIAAKRVICCV
jgi:hypothetical protein